MTGEVDWSRWTVVLLKPDCLARDLVQPVLAWVEREVQVVARRTIVPTEEQVFAHYDDMLPLSDQLGVDVPGELRRIFVGQQVGLALGHGTDAARRVRAMVGDTDPTLAMGHTIRGHFGDDSLRQARSRGTGQLINNLIHTSDTTDVVPRDVAIWYGHNARHLLADAVPATPGGTP